MILRRSGIRALYPSDCCRTGLFNHPINYKHGHSKIMECRMTVYESEESRRRNPADASRFDASRSALQSIGIPVDVVPIETAEDMDAGGEARQFIEENGPGSLPVTEYEGVLVCTGSYPSDQDLADFLDVPDGILSVDRTRPPAMSNDLPPSCCCRPRG